MALLGSGALEHLHNQDHATRDAAAAEHLAHGHDAAAGHEARCHGHGHDHGGHHAPARGHDESNCEIHAQLQMPLLAAGWVAVLVCLGLFAAFLSLLSPRLTPQRVPPRTDCRGPPAC